MVTLCPAPPDLGRILRAGHRLAARVEPAVALAGFDLDDDHLSVTAVGVGDVHPDVEVRPGAGAVVVFGHEQAEQQARQWVTGRLPAGFEFWVTRPTPHRAVFEAVPAAPKAEPKPGGIDDAVSTPSGLRPMPRPA